MAAATASRPALSTTERAEWRSGTASFKGDAIVYTRAEWQAFLAGVRAGEFNFFNDESPLSPSDTGLDETKRFVARVSHRFLSREERHFDFWHQRPCNSGDPSWACHEFVRTAGVGNDSHHTERASITITLRG